MNKREFLKDAILFFPAAATLQKLTRVGYAPVMQISCRDKNRIAIQGDILGGAAMGVCNVLCLSGDGVQAGDHPQAKPVFDLDSTSLLGIARGLRDEHRFESGRKISFAPRVLLGAAENPNVSPVEHRAVRLALASGASRVLVIVGAYAGDVVAAVRDLPVELATYKGFIRNRDAMVAWLSQYDDGQPTSPGWFPDD